MVTSCCEFQGCCRAVRCTENLLSLFSHCYRGFTFYKMSNLDNRIANADQLLTQVHTHTYTHTHTHTHTHCRSLSHTHTHTIPTCTNLFCSQDIDKFSDTLTDLYSNVAKVSIHSDGTVCQTQALCLNFTILSSLSQFWTLSCILGL